jgi:hypothetical protein
MTALLEAEKEKKKMKHAAFLDNPAVPHRQHQRMKSGRILHPIDSLASSHPFSYSWDLSVRATPCGGWSIPNAPSLDPFSGGFA